MLTHVASSHIPAQVYDQDGNGVLTRQDLREVFSATMDATESSGTNTELDVRGPWLYVGSHHCVEALTFVYAGG